MHFTNIKIDNAVDIKVIIHTLGNTTVKAYELKTENTVIIKHGKRTFKE